MKEEEEEKKNDKKIIRRRRILMMTFTAWKKSNVCVWAMISEKVEKLEEVGNYKKNKERKQVWKRKVE